ncbi:MAG: molybdopterin-guanine dinucleotide biosynthesis protein B [Selenomonadaceae bacterium]|nr:molybdopterin-guanine dinucleotide biosynthesis protein B [Selenomonadaceae bacterium]
MEFKDVSLLIIAGGQSQRMGEDKRWLEIDGCGMLERLCIKAARVPFVARFLCVGQVTPALRQLAEQYDLRLLQDPVQAQGPLPALAQGLAQIPTDYALAVAGDMPFMRLPALAPLLAAAVEHPDWQAILPQTAGRWQPLASLYRRDFAAACEQALQAGERRIRSAIDAVPHGMVAGVGASLFFNVNTPADFRLACGRMANLLREVPLVTVSAPKSNTGKTTFIERLLPKLEAAGLHVGVVKGDCHGYDVDEKGKDSWRFREAGAQAVAVVSPTGYFVQQRTAKRANLVSVAMQLQDVDLVLIESRAHGTNPQISLWRGMAEPLITEDTAAIFAKPKPDGLDGKQILLADLDDIERAARVVLFLAGH